MTRLSRSKYHAQIDALEERYSTERLKREIAAAIETMRKAAGWDQATVGKNIRSSQGTISRIERCVTGKPRWDALECIVHNLGWKLILEPGPSRVVRVEPTPRTLRGKPKPRGPQYGKR